MLDHLIAFKFGAVLTQYIAFEKDKICSIRLSPKYQKTQQTHILGCSYKSNCFYLCTHYMLPALVEE